MLLSVFSTDQVTACGTKVAGKSFPWIPTVASTPLFQPSVLLRSGRHVHNRQNVCDTNVYGGMGNISSDYNCVLILRFKIWTDRDVHGNSWFRGVSYWCTTSGNRCNISITMQRPTTAAAAAVGWFVLDVSRYTYVACAVKTFQSCRCKVLERARTKSKYITLQHKSLVILHI